MDHASASNSPWRFGTPSYVGYPHPNCIDARWFVHRERASLRSNIPPADIVPFNDWYGDGLRSGATATRVRFGGPLWVGHPAMGCLGFGAGPAKHVVDPVGLCDPPAGALARRAGEAVAGRALLSSPARRSSGVHRDRGESDPGPQPPCLHQAKAFSGCWSAAALRARSRASPGPGGRGRGVRTSGCSSG